MKIHIVDNYDQLSARAAAVVAGLVNLKRNPVLGLATGSTPEGMYKRLAQLYREGAVDFSEAITFNLDEYVGLDPGHPQSYHYYMHHHFFSHVNVPAQNIHIPSGTAKDLEAFGPAYDQKIAAAGGIDLQVLGIGGNGHIGFNEPGDCLNAQTHPVDLSKETIEDNSRFFKTKEEVPRRAVTMGMGSIFKAKSILLLASGKGKARAIKDTTCGHVTPRVPASFLQLHREVIVIVDKEAASLL